VADGIDRPGRLRGPANQWAQRVARQRDAVAVLRRSGVWRIIYDWQWEAQPRIYERFRAWIGPDCFHNVIAVRAELRPEQPVTSVIEAIGKLDHLRVLELSAPLTDQDLRVVGTLKNLDRLVIQQLHSSEQAQITDQGVEHLASLPRLRELEISGARLSGRGIRALKQVYTLSILELKYTEFSEGALIAIAELSQLNELSLAYSHPIRDEDLPRLATTVNLKRLNINGPWFSRDDLERLYAVLKGTQIDVIYPR
jgi:hypothetical protein